MRIENLKEKVALVTGASRRIGRASALALVINIVFGGRAARDRV